MFMAQEAFFEKKDLEARNAEESFMVTHIETALLILINSLFFRGFHITSLGLNALQSQALEENQIFSENNCEKI